MSDPAGSQLEAVTSAEVSIPRRTGDSRDDTRCYVRSQSLQAWLGVPDPTTERGRQALQAGLEALTSAIVRVQRERNHLIRCHGGRTAMPVDVRHQERELAAYRRGLQEALAMLLSDDPGTHGALLSQVRNVVGPLWPPEGADQ